MIIIRYIIGRCKIEKKYKTLRISSFFILFLPLSVIARCVSTRQSHLFFFLCYYFLGNFLSNIFIFYFTFSVSLFFCRGIMNCPLYLHFTIIFSYFIHLYTNLMNKSFLFYNVSKYHKIMKIRKKPANPCK